MKEKTRDIIEELINKVFKNKDEKEYRVLKYLKYDTVERKHYFLVEFLESGNQKILNKFDVENGRGKDIWYDVNGISINSTNIKEELKKHNINYNTMATNLFRNGFYQTENVLVKKAKNVKIMEV